MTTSRWRCSADMEDEKALLKTGEAGEAKADEILEGLVKKRWSTMGSVKERMKDEKIVTGIEAGTKGVWGVLRAGVIRREGAIRFRSSPSYVGKRKELFARATRVGWPFVTDNALHALQNEVPLA